MIKIHGPWTDKQLGRGQRADKKHQLLEAARLKQCACSLCEKGQRGLPENVMWVRDGEDRYIVSRPVVL